MSKPDTNLFFHVNGYLEIICDCFCLLILMYLHSVQAGLISIKPEPIHYVTEKKQHKVIQSHFLSKINRVFHIDFRISLKPHRIFLLIFCSLHWWLTFRPSVPLVWCTYFLVLTACVGYETNSLLNYWKHSIFIYLCSSNIMNFPFRLMLQHFMLIDLHNDAIMPAREAHQKV